MVGLRKAFGPQIVLDDIDLEVPGGTVFSLLGPNGAGKTTTVQILSTLIAADAGEVLVAGHDVEHERTWSAEWIAEKRTALADPEFQRLYVAFGQALDWDPADPRLEELADAMVTFIERRHVGLERAEPLRISDQEAPAVALLSSYLDKAVPSWERLNELCTIKLQASRRP